MILSPQDWRCPHPDCRARGKHRPSIPGVVSARWCYRHMPEETRAVLRAMGDA